MSRKISKIDVPDTIQGIIAARLDRLEENLKRTMQVASVIGRDFAFRILQTITGMREELKSYLLNLQGLEFIYEKSLFPDLEYIFKHSLTQEVAYNSLLLARRKRIHEEIGKAIEKLYFNRLEELFDVLAYHYSKSENYEKAHHYYKLSGEKAFAKYSHWEAFQAFKAAIEALNQLPISTETQKAQIEIRSFISTPMRLLSYPEGSLDILKEGAIYAKEVNDTQSLIIFYSLIGKYYAFKGDPLKQRKYQEDCFQNALKIQDVDVMAPLCDDLCSSYSISGEYYRATEFAPVVIELLEETKRESEFFGKTSCVYSSISYMHGLGLGFMGKFKEGENFIFKALKYAYQTSHPYSIALAENGVAYFFNIKGEGENAIKHSKIAIDYFEQTKALTWLSTAFAGLGFGYILEEKFDKAKKYLEKGLSIHKEIGIPVFISNFYIGLGELDYYAHDLNQAHKNFRKALTLSQKISDRLAEGISYSWLGRILWRHEPDKSFTAEECLNKSIKVLRDLKANPYIAQAYLFIGELYIDQGKRGNGLEKLKKASKMFREMGMDYWLTKTQEILGRL